MGRLVQTLRVKYSGTENSRCKKPDAGMSSGQHSDPGGKMRKEWQTRGGRSPGSDHGSFGFCSHWDRRGMENFEQNKGKSAVIFWGIILTFVWWARIYTGVVEDMKSNGIGMCFVR